MNKNIILLLAIFIFISESTSAQNFLVGFGFGYNKITNESYFSDKPGDNHGIGLGLNNLKQISVKLKYDLNFIPVYLTSDLAYYGGNNDAKYFGSTNPLSSFLTDIKLESSLDIYSIGLGIDYPIHLNKFIPYFSVSLLANYYKIKAEQSPQPGNSFKLVPDNFNSELKIGASFGAGLDYKIYENFLIGLSLKYSFMNISDKEFKAFWFGEVDDGINMFNISVNALYGLNIF